MSLIRNIYNGKDSPCNIKQATMLLSKHKHKINRRSHGNGPTLAMLFYEMKMLGNNDAKEIYPVLIELGADESLTWDASHVSELSAACKAVDVERVRDLIENNHDVHSRDFWTGYTPLASAVRTSCLGSKLGPIVSIVTLLVMAGADINAKDVWNETPLRHSHPSIRAELIRLGATL